MHPGLSFFMPVQGGERPNGGNGNQIGHRIDNSRKA